jgi:hypothetical protein
MMKTIQTSTLMTCVLLLAGAAGAQTVTVQNTLDYQDNESLDTWFVETGAILDHYPFCRGSNQDWGWTHDVTNSIPNGATGIASATITIISWKIDVEEGEDDVIYVMPKKPGLTTSITRNATELGLLKGYQEAPTNVSWSSNGQINYYEDLWSVTTFTLPADVIDDLWANGKLYFYVDIEQTGYDGLRATLESSVLRINYFAPEPETPDTTVVYRFWSPITSSHFYTISEDEAQGLIINYAWAWVYEGIAYRAMADDADVKALPVYRFWSPLAGGHFFTINQAEKDYIIANYSSSVWTYEGIAFYAFPAGEQPTDTMPVYRFWSPLVSHHFYTMNEAEKDYILATYASDIWTYEGIAWYAYMP